MGTNFIVKSAYWHTWNVCFVSHTSHTLPYNMADCFWGTWIENLVTSLHPIYTFLHICCGGPYPKPHSGTSGFACTVQYNPTKSKFISLLKLENKHGDCWYNRITNQTDQSSKCRVSVLHWTCSINRSLLRLSWNSRVNTGRPRIYSCHTVKNIVKCCK